MYVLPFVAVYIYVFQFMHQMINLTGFIKPYGRIYF